MLSTLKLKIKRYTKVLTSYKFGPSHKHTNGKVIMRVWLVWFADGEAGVVIYLEHSLKTIQWTKFLFRCCFLSIRNLFICQI